MDISRQGTGQKLVARPALIAALDGAFDRRLTLIAAQAGAGKTTLLRQWVAAHPERHFTRLDVEAADDDPAHFARRWITALNSSRPATARASATIPAQGDGFGPALIASMANALASPHETVILLDDVHHFTNVTLVADLGRLIERMPRNAHVVLASRVDPPIALSRYRLNDDLLELRPAQLAFSESESAALLEQISGRRLEPAQVRTLRDRTEGWAAGLQLAALRLRREPDADSFISEFSGSDRLVADYLGEEVIAGLPPARRRLLLEMSVLDDMCASLVDAATGTSNAQQILEELEHECMFLVPLDAQRRWFRFHHLFSDLLRSRVRAENPAAELRILTAAADWHLARSSVKSALQYLLRAQARDGAMEAMLASVADDAAHGEVRTLPHRQPPLRDALRTAQMNEELFAGLRHAWGGGTSSQASPVNGRGNGRTDVQRGWGFVAAQVLWRARPDISTDEARRRLAELTQNGPATHATSAALVEILVSGGRAYFLAGNTNEARAWLSRALVAAASDVVGRVSALGALSLVEAWCRNTALAEILMRDALEAARDAGMLAHPAIADAYLASVLTALEPQPAKHPEPAPQLAPDDESDTAPAPSDAATVRHPLATRPPPRPAESGVAAFDDQKLVATVLFERAAASITLGDTEPAREMVAAWDELVQVSTPLSVVQNHILRARLAAIDETPDEAIRELTSALKVAEIHGLVEVFVQAGPLILQRLSMISGPQAAFSDVIRTRARQEDVPVSVDLAEPLTERERELLAYLPTRFTNDELARRFYVSVNTIKTHMAHIYRKLDATTRDGAIERARELGLL
ncbi:LuxR C-terminal-related transcriptional regulator [Mycetocola sp. 2940]|uniref:LuxR C-terminal-related transcriptional regulator n=1 Tax=Mycetocola sp. 2940 TaxID=3156452 RepID=UPI00339988CD